MPERDSPYLANQDIAAEDFLFHLYRGSEFLQDNRVHDAKVELEQALALQPSDPKGQDLLGIVYFRLGLYPRAIAIYEQLVRAHPEAIEPRINLALSYLKTGQPARASIELERAVEQSPGHSRAWGYLGLALQRLGDYERASQAFLSGGHDAMAKRVLEMAPQGPPGSLKPHDLAASRDAKTAVSSGGGIAPPGSIAAATLPAGGGAPPRASDFHELGREDDGESLEREVEAARAATGTWRPLEAGRAPMPIPGAPQTGARDGSLTNFVTAATTPAPARLNASGLAAAAASGSASEPAAATGPAHATGSGPWPAVSPAAGSVYATTFVSAHAPAPAPSPSPSPAPGPASASSPLPRPAPAPLPAPLRSPQTQVSRAITDLSAPRAAIDGGPAGRPNVTVQPTQPPPSSVDIPSSIQRFPAVPPRPATDVVRGALLVFPRELSVSLHPSGAVLVKAPEGFAARLSLVRSLCTPSEPSATPLKRRTRGRVLDEPLGGAAAPLVEIAGNVEIVLGPGPNQRLLPIAVHEEPLYLREELLSAFELTVSYENGRLPIGDGEAIPMVQLRSVPAAGAAGAAGSSAAAGGSSGADAGANTNTKDAGGTIIAAMPESLITIEIVQGHRALVRGLSVLGWTGRVMPRALLPSEALAGTRGLVALSGEGMVLLDGR
jgi:hypothetical protein